MYWLWNGNHGSVGIFMETAPLIPFISNWNQGDFRNCYFLLQKTFLCIVFFSASLIYDLQQLQVCTKRDPELYLKHLFTSWKNVWRILPANWVNNILAGGVEAKPRYVNIPGVQDMGMEAPEELS